MKSTVKVSIRFLGKDVSRMTASDAVAALGKQDEKEIFQALMKVFDGKQMYLSSFSPMMHSPTAGVITGNGSPRKGSILRRRQFLRGCMQTKVAPVFGQEMPPDVSASGLEPETIITQNQK